MPKVHAGNKRQSMQPFKAKIKKLHQPVFIYNNSMRVRWSLRELGRGAQFISGWPVDYSHIKMYTRIGVYMQTVYVFV